jgi:ribokinase
MESGPEILVLGSVNRDLVVHAPRPPLPGEKLRGQRFGSCLGGKGANQPSPRRAWAHAWRSRRASACARTAPRWWRSCNARAWMCTPMRSRRTTPGVALIVVGAEDAENQIVTVAGSNGTLPLEQVEALELDGLRWLVAQQELPLAAWPGPSSACMPPA